jgi:hypothetical protein
MRVVRIIGVLEPGGAQLSALRLSRALAGFGADSSLLLAGDATEAGIGVACRYGVAIEAFSPGEHRRLQWTPDGAFVDWLRPGWSAPTSSTPTCSAPGGRRGAGGRRYAVGGQLAQRGELAARRLQRGGKGRCAAAGRVLRARPGGAGLRRNPGPGSA